MNENLEIEVAKLVGFMCAAFPYAQVSEASTATYVAGLKEIPMDVLRPAIEQCICDYKFLPTIAQVREMAAELTKPDNEISVAMEGWAKLKKEIQRTGYYRVPSFDDPIVKEVVGMMGWQNLCLSENEVADRAHFCKVYDQLLERDRRRARLCPSARALQDKTNGLARTEEIGDGRGF